MAAPEPMRRWPSPCLMLVTDRTRLRGRRLEDVVSQAVEGGANVVQLREKDLPGGELYDQAKGLRAAIGDRALLLVNERADVALAAGADGVHLPERGLPGGSVRDIVGESYIVGRSVHSVDAAVRAEKAGAHYVEVGTVYETASKPDAVAAGVALVEAVAQAVDVPVVAIGGITAENAAAVVDAGAAGVAVIGAIMDADDPKPATAALRRVLDAACGR